MIADGDKAPDFELPTDGGETLELSRLKGKPAVLYFYPKDDTSGCTRRGQGLHAGSRPTSARPASRSSACRPTASESHAKFRRQVRSRASASPPTPYKAVASAYGVWVEKIHVRAASTWASSAPPS